MCDVARVRYSAHPRLSTRMWPGPCNQKCALLTDGRFSGASHGIVIGHITPEAQTGGPIALVEDGDEVGLRVQLCMTHACLQIHGCSPAVVPQGMAGVFALLCTRVHRYCCHYILLDQLPAMLTGGLVRPALPT